MRHLGWFLLLLVVATCFYVRLYHGAIETGSTYALMSLNETYKLDLTAESKNLRECMAALPDITRAAIYERHRKELADKMNQK